MYGQIGAVTGLKKRPGHTDIINAEVPHLPSRVQAKKDKEFADKTFAFNEEQAKMQQQLDWETGHDQRKQQNTANNLGYANLGLNVLGETGALGGLYDSIMTLFS